MKKNIWISCTAAAVVALLLMIFLPVLAAPSVSPSLRFEGTTAVAEVAITAKKEHIDVTVRLLESGKEDSREAAAWQLIGEEQVSLCERVEAVPGRNYILTLEGTIGSRTIHVNSVSATCPGEESIETQPAEPELTVPEETKPAPTEPEETQPALTEPEDSKPAPTEPAEAQRPVVYDEQFGSFSAIGLQYTAPVEKMGSLLLTEPLADLLIGEEDDCRFAVWVYPCLNISVSETLGDVQEMAEELTAAGIEAEVIPYWYVYRYEGNAVEDRAPIAYTVKTTLTKSQILELSGEKDPNCSS